MGLNSQIVDLSQVNKVDEDLVGKKAHDLGTLWKLGVPLPKGFVVTAQFQKEFLSLSGINKEINKTQALMHPALADSINKLFHPVQKKIMHTHIPQILSQELHRFYRQLSGIFKNQPLNVFSSSSNNKSVVFFNIKGDANLVLKIKTIWSLFLDQPAAIVIQKNLKTQTNGKISTNSPVTDKKLTEKQITELTNYCKIIQKHFYFPKEIEYTVNKGKIFIVGINPFTGTQTVKNKQFRKMLIKGIPINPGIVTGYVKVFRNKYDCLEAKRGEIVILHDYDKKTFKKIKNAKAAVIDSILPDSLDKAIFRRNFRFPTIEGAKNAAKMLHDGKVVTVNGGNGEIYSGGLIY